jgi:non-specific serine/threonine protein kinase/serine/threonine-protein kinase
VKAERWQQVRSILDRAIELPASERSPYLDQNCADDPELREEVESLLRSHVEAGSVFLKNPAANLKTALEIETANRIGSRIGVYQIREEIGHGGMGEVYGAVRADGQYEKAVAIKLVRGGYDTTGLLQRFRHERQILASLDHPNIARLLDGGTTEDGIPYLVMELIEGERIDTYCDARRLSISERLRLFCDICSAVQYAHQRLIIHRDLKPGNVLVTSDGIPKLLDFGIAKLIDPDSLGETTLVRPMTPEYASPEQIRGEPITTASDVYSLGVVLYQLLTGRSPYPGETRSSHHLGTAICETDPTRPSTAVLKPVSTSQQDQALASSEDLAKVREGSPAKLQRRLAGDIDNIVLKAMRKEPHQRYISVEQFAEDIRRHLQGLPVTAVKGSFAYRAKKFVRRNRMAIAAGTLLAITVLAGIAATIRQARIARKQAEIATIERAKAEKRFSDVRELANSLIFEIHDSIQGLPGATPSRKLLLDRAVQYLDKLSSDSAGDVNLQRELAWAYQRLATVQGDTTQSNLGQVGAADLSNRKATALFESVAKANPNNVTDQLNLAMAYRWRAFFDIYETTGRAEIDRALAVTEPLSRTNPDNLDVKNELAQEYTIRADIQDAVGDRLDSINSYKKVRDLRQEILNTNPAYSGARRALAKITVVLAHEMGRFGSPDEAIPLMNQGITDFQALAKETKDPGLIREVAAAESRRGDVELIQGNVTAALKDFQSSLRRFEPLAKLDPENKMLQSDVWVGRFEYGRALAVGGRHSEALRVMKDALRGYQSLHLEADVGVAPSTMRGWIAEAQAGTHDLRGALKNLETSAAALAEDQANFDDARCELAMVETKIGNVLLLMGNPGEAKQHYEKGRTTAKLPESTKHNDIPALYAAAEAYAGLGEIAASQSRSIDDIATRQKLLTDACTSYQSTVDIWKRIPHQSRYTGGGYLSRDPATLAQQMAICNTN